MKSQWLTLSLLSMSSLSSFGQGFQDAQTIDDLVVTATRIEERVIDVPVTTQVITAEQIELSGVTTVGDLIAKYVTGHYQKYNGLLSPVGLRGFSTEAHGDDVKGYVLILIDGHRIGTGNAAKINPDRIERIEVVKGPASALYGSAAMGGVVNLITKKGDGDLTTALSGDFGSFDYYKGQVSSGGKINDQWRFHATASYEDVSDYDDPKFGTVYNTGETKKNIGGNLVYTINANHELRFGGNIADLSGYYPAWLNYKTYGAYDPAASQNYDKSHRYADLEYNGKFLDGAVHWRGLAYYLWDRNHWNYGPNSNPAAEQAKYTDTTLGTDNQFVWNVNSWNKLLLGFNLEHLEKESEGVSKGQPANPYTPSMEYDSQALFIENTTDLLDNRVNIIAAGRYDRFDVTTLRPKTGTFPDFNEKSEVYDHFSPKLGIGAKFLDEQLRVRANVGEGFKSPSADQLSADYVNPPTGVRYVGNPDLKPETSLTYDIGFDVFQGPFTLKASYFHTDFEDKIVQVNKTIDGEKIVTYNNHGDAEMAGFDLGLEWRMGRLFDSPLYSTLWANATFNTTKKDKETGKELLWISDYELKAGLIVNYERFSGQLNYVLVGPQMITNYDTYVDEEKDSFDFWDLTGRYQFSKNWEVRASILNLFDQEVEWVRGYLMPERNYRLGVSYNF